MFTKNQLDQLRTVVREEIDNRAEQTEKKFDKRIEEAEMKTELRFQAMDNQFQTIDTRFQTMDTRFDSIDKDLHAIRQQQDQDRKDWIGFFHEVGEFIEEIKQKLLKRIERIENHLNFSKN